MQSPPAKKSTLGSTFFAVFFWMFNVSLLLILYLGFLPFIGSGVIADAFKGEVPLDFLIPFVGLVGMPTASAFVTPFRRKLNPKTYTPPKPVTLFQFFYGIEAPILLVCLIRFWFLRDLTPGAAYLFLSVFISSLAFVHWLKNARDPEHGQANWWHLAGLSVLLSLSLYFAAIALLYAPPILWSIALSLVFIIIFLVILFPLAMLPFGFLTLPFGMLTLYGKAWLQSAKQLVARQGKVKVGGFVTAVIAVWLTGALMVQQQPQLQAFRLLEKSPQNDGDRQMLIQNSDLIRKGLLNAYLAEYRYPFVDSRLLQDLYSWMGFPQVSTAGIQQVHNWLIAPFAYDGNGTDKAQAEKLYAEFFDTPILRGERSAIQKAVMSNWNRWETKAGLLQVNAKQVHLESQDLTVTPEGDWAEVELHEVYMNQTEQQREILYYFSLPESATITGLWLGNSADLNARFAADVSPRGAAQQVYNDEVNRRVDPALLEQVGPRNYRLRAFPIPPRSPIVGQTQQPMHLWMTFKVLKQDAGWVMPELNEQRNIYWNGNTKRSLNGKELRGNGDRWLPASIPADKTVATAHQVQLPSGYIFAKPIADKEMQLPKGKHLALVVDSSRSMASHSTELAESFKWMQANLLAANTVDLFSTQFKTLNASSDLTAKVSTNVKTLDPKQFTFYGSLQPNEMLTQFNNAAAAQAKAAGKPDKYDAVIVMTDAGSYELTADRNKPVALSAPLWMVHLGGLQPSYDDATLDALQRGGGSVSTQVQEVAQRIATQPTLGEGTSLLNVVDGYAWFLSQQSSQPQNADGFEPLAARQWIAQVSQSVKPEQLSQLDAIHSVAKKNRIVSPYSSMLVLVEQRQRDALKAAEQGQDRFKREIEDQQLPQPQSAIAAAPVSAVPEPSEWLLLVAVLVGLGFVYRWQMLQTQTEAEG